MSKTLWSIPIGDLSFDGPRLPKPNFWVGFAAGVAVTAAVLFGSGIAHADTPDQQFLNAVHSNGVGGQDDTLIAYGHEYCEQTAGIYPDGPPLLGQGVMGNQFYIIQIAASRAYCPAKIVLPPQRPPIFTGL